MVSIRPYEPGDDEAIQRLHRVALEATGTDPADVPGTDDLADVESSYIEPGGAFLVAERDDGEGGVGDGTDSLVGMGGLKLRDGQGEAVGDDGDGAASQATALEAELFRMRVHPDCQRSGIGSALLAALEACARERGVAVLHAETALRQTAATHFYPAHGYEEVRRRTVGEYDLIAYAKEL